MATARESTDTAREAPGEPAERVLSEELPDSLSYDDDAIENVEGGVPLLRHFHWGLFEDPENADGSPAGYYEAAESMTEEIVTAGEVADGAWVLDVGCGFGGTLDHIRNRNQGCRLAGVNIDERQLRLARKLLAEHVGVQLPFVKADGCSLPVADGSVDHVLAVECIFHFPSRKQFFREAARVLRPGGTLALSDFLTPPGGLRKVVQRLSTAGMDNYSYEGYHDPWFGYRAKALTSAAYRRLGRGTGFDLLVDDDVTARTMPTYPALRGLYDTTKAAGGVQAIDALEDLAVDGALTYNVLAFRRQET